MQRTNDTINVIGIGDDGKKGLPSHVVNIIGNADCLIGGSRLLSFFPDFKGKTFIIKSNLNECLEFINNNRGKIVVLASGDPLFYGIGAYLVDKLGKNKVEIIPCVSSMQIAFAKARVPWQDARLISLHARPLKNILAAAESAKIIGVFTDKKNNPNVIAKYLVENGYGDFSAVICENINGENECITESTITELAAGTREFSSLNVLILEKKEKVLEIDTDNLPVFGIPDDFFIYRVPNKGLITKREIRVLALAEMKINNTSIVWDIGAGAGSVTVESARLAEKGHVYCVEKNRDDFELIEKNLKRFSINNVTAVNSKAPDGISAWQNPDAVFIGGSGGELKEICTAIRGKQKKGARIVVNTITIETQTMVYELLKKFGYEVKACLVNIARSKPVLDMTRFEPLNPITIFTGIKK